MEGDLRRRLAEAEARVAAVEEQDKRILEQRMKKKDEQISNLKWRVSFTESLAGLKQDFDFDGLVHIDRNGKKVGGPGGVSGAASAGSPAPSASSSSSASGPSTPLAGNANRAVIKSGGKTPQPPKAEPPATRAQISLMQPPPQPSAPAPRPLGVP